MVARHSSVLSQSPALSRAICVMPMMALMGVRMSWDIFAKNPETDIIDQRNGDRAGLRKTFLFIALLMIVCGTLTAWKNYSIGAELIENGQEATRYVLADENNWWK